MDENREYGLNQGYDNSDVVKVSDNNNNNNDYDDDEVEDEEEEEEEQDETIQTNVGDNELNETKQNGDGVDDDDDRYDDDDDDDGGDDDDVNQQRHPKKRKLKSLLSSYEFAPRVPPPTSAPKPSFGGRNTLTDWSEHETFVLLDAWGERYLKCGRKSLRSDEWLEVADRVSQQSKHERTDSQCRNRLDTLKKKYKKEKASLNSGKIVTTKWVYFKKMDMLLSSGGSALKSPSVSLNIRNGLNETRGISGNSYSHDDEDVDDDDDDESDTLPVPPKKLKPKASFKLLADSINKFSEIYEKIENNKIQQMIELEKMKMDFHKDLELQKRQILDRAQAEITKVRQGDYEDNDVSAENISG